MKTASYEEPGNLGDFLLFEEEHFYSRGTVTVKSGQAAVLKPGHVLGQLTADEKYTPHVNGAADGSETAKVVLIEEVDATGGDDVEALVIKRHAIVAAPGLIWDASVDDATKRAAAIADLEAVGIVARDGA